MNQYSIDNYLIMESRTLHRQGEFQFCEAQDNENLKLKIQAIVITYRDQLIHNLSVMEQLQQINHPNVMKIYFTKELEHGKLILISEQCFNTLSKHLRFENNRNHYTKGDALRFIYQISSGFVKLHENNISLSNFSLDTIFIKKDKDNLISYKLFGQFMILDESFIKLRDCHYCYEFGQILKSLFSTLNCGDQDIKDIINQLINYKNITWKNLKERINNLLLITSNEDQIKNIEVYKPQNFRYFSENNHHKSQSMTIPKHQQQSQILKKQIIQSTNTNNKCQTIQPVQFIQSAQTLQNFDAQANNNSLNHCQFQFFDSQQTQIQNFGQFQNIDAQANNNSLNHCQNQFFDFQQTQIQAFGQFNNIQVIERTGKINIPCCKYKNWLRAPPNKQGKLKEMEEEAMRAQQFQNFNSLQELNFIASDS